MASVHMVALSRWGAPLETELPVLAGWVGLNAYDLRLKLAGVLPVIFSTHSDAFAAAELVARLRARGHGAVACESARVPGEIEHFVVRDFELGPAAIRGTCTRGRDFELPYAEIAALIRAAVVSTSQSTSTTQEKKFDMGMALISGGLKLNKKVDRVTHTASEAREQALYVLRRSAGAPLLCKELAMHYGELGALRKPTTLLNFQVVTEQLRQRAPSALFDQRFVTYKRKLGISAVAGTEKQRTVDSSNASDTELAAYLLLLAHQQGQL